MVFAAFYNTLRDGKRCAKMLSDELQFRYAFGKRYTFIELFYLV